MFQLEMLLSACTWPGHVLLAACRPGSGGLQVAEPILLFFPFVFVLSDLVGKCSGDLGAVDGNEDKPKPVVGYKYAKGLARRCTYPGQDVFLFLIGA